MRGEAGRRFESESRRDVRFHCEILLHEEIYGEILRFYEYDSTRDAFDALDALDTSLAHANEDVL